MKEKLKTNTIVMKKFNAVCGEKIWSGFDFNKDWNVFLSRLNKKPAPTRQLLIGADYYYYESKHEVPFCFKAGKRGLMGADCALNNQKLIIRPTEY